jgi:hypothetical protein
VVKLRKDAVFFNFYNPYNVYNSYNNKKIHPFSTFKILFLKQTSSSFVLINLNDNIMRSTLKFGLLTGLVSSIFLYGFFSLMIWLNTKNGWGMQASEIRGIGGLLSIPVQAIGIYMAMQNTKKLTGMLTYGQAVKTGLLVALTIAIVVAIFSFLYCQYINPGYAEFMIKDAQKTMIANKESQQQINQDSVMISKQFTTGAQVMMALAGQFFTGLIISLIIGLFIKTKK